MLDIHERDRKINQWMKLGGLAYDINHDDDLRGIFVGQDEELQNQTLEEYDLTREDFLEFHSDMDVVILGIWWVGDEQLVA